MALLRIVKGIEEDFDRVIAVDLAAFGIAGLEAFTTFGFATDAQVDVCAAEQGSDFSAELSDASGG